MKYPLSKRCRYFKRSKNDAKGGICLQNRSRDEQETFGRLMSASLKGLLSAVGFSLGLSLVFTAILLRLEDPLRPIRIFAVAALLLGAAIGGIVSSGCVNDPAAGAVCGAEYVMLIWLVSLFFRGSAKTPLSLLWISVGYAVCVVTAFLCGGLSIRWRSSGRREHSPTAARRRAARKRH